MEDRYDDEDLVVNEGDESEVEEAFIRYDIASYPSDLTLSVIFDMWKAEDLEIPKFQRHFVWNIKQSSLLIESFLMGLPVPQAFIYVDDENKNLVIDGQQRITSIIYFFEGYFGSESIQGKRQVFRLSGLNEKSPYYKKRFQDLSESDQRKLKGATFRFMNVRQITPKENQTAIYHIFERLNTGGTPLKPQEIRNCVFRGELVEILGKLNKTHAWRKIIGKKNLDKHQKDVELLLRVFALFEDWRKYEKPMKEFLNKAMKKNRFGDTDKIMKFKEIFPSMCDRIIKEFGEKPFHVRGPLNASALDSVMCILLERDESIPDDLKGRYSRLMEDKTFQETTYYGTSDESVLKKRFQTVESYLA